MNKMMLTVVTSRHDLFPSSKNDKWCIHELPFLASPLIISSANSQLTTVVYTTCHELYVCLFLLILNQLSPPVQT